MGLTWARKEKVGDVGMYAGFKREYWSEGGLYPGLVGEYSGDVGEYAGLVGRPPAITHHTPAARK